MRNSAMLIATLLGLAACGGGDPVESCEAYTAALNTCYEEAGVTTLPITDDFCAGYDGLKGEAKKNAVEILDCYAEKISGGDCSSATGAGDAFASILECDAA